MTSVGSSKINHIEYQPYRVSQENTLCIQKISKETIVHLKKKRKKRMPNLSIDFFLIYTCEKECGILHGMSCALPTYNAEFIS